MAGRPARSSLAGGGIVGSVAARPELAKCHSCGIPIIAALPTCGPATLGPPVALDLVPTSLAGEYLAISHGLETYNNFGDLVVFRMLRDVLAKRSVPVHIQHRCGLSFDADPDGLRRVMLKYVPQNASETIPF